MTNEGAERVSSSRAEEGKLGDDDQDALDE